jgi:hypothetical protein
MSFTTNRLLQKATYWAPGAPDGFGGQTFASPQTINVRWEDRVQLFVDDFGEEVRSRAVVFTEVDILTDGYLFLGESNASDPTTVEGSYLIRQFRKIPNLGNNFYERKVVL